MNTKFRLLPKNLFEIIQLLSLLGISISPYFFYQWIHNNIPYVSLLIIVIITILSLLIIIPKAYLLEKELNQLSKQPLEERKNLKEELGVYWNNNLKKRCLNCMSPLTPSSKPGDSSIFFCSRCHKKHPLKKDGHLLTEQQAIGIVKEMYPDFFISN